jgi:hypothetical protein
VSIARTVAIVLTGLIGVSGLGVGLSLWISLATMEAAGDTRDIGPLIYLGIAAYGLITALAAFGVWRGNVVAWWAAVIAIAAGIALLVRLATLGLHLDEVFTGGVIIWGADLVALLAPGTRRALGAGSDGAVRPSPGRGRWW